MGCSIFITTNAAGFINQKMKLGDIALINDHISMINKTCDGSINFDPLFTINKDTQNKLMSSSDLYDAETMQIARKTFAQLGKDFVEGPYCYYALPNYES